MPLKRNKSRIEDIKKETGMEQFQYTSHLEKGLDIRTAGEFVKEAIKCSSRVTIRNGSRKGDAKLIFNVMSLGVHKNDILEIEIEGDNEKEDAVNLLNYMREHL